jgi:hypothetical protein
MPLYQFNVHLTSQQIRDLADSGATELYRDGPGYIIGCLVSESGLEAFLQLHTDLRSHVQPVDKLLLPASGATDPPA